MYQTRFDEIVEIAVEHLVDISRFDFGPKILDEPVRMKNVGTNLVPPGDVGF